MAKRLPNTLEQKPWAPSQPLVVLLLALVAFTAFIVFLPTLVLWGNDGIVPDDPVQFPVSVDPSTKTISENPEIEARINDEHSTLGAAVLSAGRDAVNALAMTVSTAKWYQVIASAQSSRVVVIYPGYRKEQVVAQFGNALGWSPQRQKAFLTTASKSIPTLTEGKFSPGMYVVETGMSESDVQSMIYNQFSDRYLERYGTSTQEIVPLKTALTIASLIEREAGSREEMRLISGIIWNRIFMGMKLQIDATLQYARGTSSNGWWPVPRSRDKYIQSAYNTYTVAGLPPGPIANPSVAAVVAALNPKKTDCLFYFHDADGAFFCSKTYEEHVQALKKSYGRGK